MLRHYFHLKPGSVPKWSNGADCKSAGLRLRGFESHLTHHPSLFKSFGWHATPSKHSYVKKEAILRRHTCEGCPSVALA